MNAANDEMEVLAAQITRAYEQNDMVAIAACYAPDARIWHNFAGAEQTVEEQLDAARWLNERLRTSNTRSSRAILSRAVTSTRTSCTALSPAAATLSVCRPA
jgi:hypothetical protein